MLTPQQRLAEARAQYERALTGNDAGAITSAADAYLSEARSFYASGDAYSAIFAAVVVAVTGRANAPASITGTPTAGSGAPVAVSPATASATAAQSAATTAVAAANATVDAVNATKLLLAQIIAETRTTVSAEAQATRANDVTNTDRVVAAVADRGNIRVL